MPPGFRERARREALRYGSDRWVFVRELLQNARDAGARVVRLTTGEAGGVARVVCRDDGTGMSFDHARRYLFALYASSKEKDPRAVGRFGVGFWSVLRLDPVRIVVRSWPAEGEPWEVELDGDLQSVERRAPPSRSSPGTEVLLEARPQGGHLARRVRDAAWQSARYLRRRDDPRRALAVYADGELLSVPFDLPAPSTTFRKGGMRGAVGLGSEARIELFARGLRVRSAAALEDLLAPDGSSGRSRVRFPTLAFGVAPQAILDGDDLEPLLARADVRDSRSLRRLVELAQVELRRLVERHLDAARPRPLWPRLRGSALAAVGFVAFGAGVWWGTAPAPGRLPVGDRIAADTSLTLLRPAIARPVAYRDLAAVYDGPRSDTLPEHAAPVALRYAPASERLHLAALVLERPLDAPSAPARAGAAGGAACRRDCVDVALAIDDGPGALRLPIPTGHRLDVATVRLDGRPVDAAVSAAGEPFVVLERAARGVVRYRTGPSSSPLAPSPTGPLEPSLSEVAARLRALPSDARIAAATAWVRRHVVYSTAPETVERHRVARRAGRDLLGRALAVGAGDCDVQNAVLTLLLQGSGLHARLAVGYLGEGGVALAPLHAWVEVRDASGPWQVADASLSPTPLPEEEVAVASAPRPIDDLAPVPEPVRPLAIETVAGPGLLAAAGPWLVASLLAGAGLGTLGYVLSRPRRTMRLAPDPEIAPLLRGALERPEAFRHVPAVFDRRLVPLLGARSSSLRAVWSLADARRLFRSATRSSLAARAAAGGAAVLDAARPEGRAVADALGAVDLDEWDVFLARSQRPPVLAAVDARLRRLGEPWEVRAVPGLDAPAVLDLPSKGGTSRIVVVAGDAPWLAAAAARFRERPREAVFDVVERLCGLVGAAGEERRRILGTLAREALCEAAR